MRSPGCSGTRTACCTAGWSARGSGRPDLHFPLRRITTPPAPGDITASWIRDQILSVLDVGTRLPAYEAAYFADRLLVHLTSCDARREGQWEKVAWWDFIRAGEMSREYQTLLGIGQTRNLVATRAEVASTRTVGRVIIEALILWGLFGRGMDGDADIDRVLNAPTSEAWIDPWEAHLRSLGVEFVTGTQVLEVGYAGGRVTGVDPADGPIDTDHVVLTGGPQLGDVGALAGGRVFAGGTRHQVVVTAPLVLQYTALHVGLFVLFGWAAAGLFAIADREPRFMFVVFTLFCSFQVVAFAAIAVLARWVLGSIA